MITRVYKGRFGEESHLFDWNNNEVVLSKGDFIFFEEQAYKVLYVMHDVDHNDLNVFVRLAIEEDF